MAITFSTTQTITSTGQLFNGSFTPCGNYLLAGGYDGNLHRWKLTAEAPAEQKAIEGHQGWMQAFICHPDQTLVYSGDSWGRLACHDYSQDEPETIWAMDAAHDGWIRSLVISSQGEWLATCGKDQLVRIFKTKNGRQTGQFAGHNADVYCLAIHPASQTLVSADALGKVIAWDMKKRVPRQQFDATELFLQHRLQDVGGVKAMTFSPDGQTLFISGTRPKGGGNVQGVPLILGFNWESGKQVFTRELGATSDVYVHSMQFHPDGYLMAVTSGNPGTGKLVFIDLQQQEPLYSNNTLSNCHAISLHPTGKLLAVTTTSKGSNGNGRRLDEQGNYIGNHSPIYFLSPADPDSTDKAP